MNDDNGWGNGSDSYRKASGVKIYTKDYWGDNTQYEYDDATQKRIFDFIETMSKNAYDSSEQKQSDKATIKEKLKQLKILILEGDFTKAFDIIEGIEEFFDKM